jgi:hypothetical protein
VKRKNGSDARPAITEMERLDGDNKFIIHVAAVSCAATAVPEKGPANQILRKTRFRQALGIEFTLMREVAVKTAARQPLVSFFKSGSSECPLILQWLRAA